MSKTRAPAAVPKMAMDRGLHGQLHHERIEHVAGMGLGIPPPGSGRE